MIMKKIENTRAAFKKFAISLFLFSLTIIEKYKMEADACIHINRDNQ